VLFGRAEQHSDQATAQAFADAVSHAFIAGFGFATLAQVVIIFAAGRPTSRPAISTLAAIRLTSHSHGPGSVSSKSFGPKNETY
jgi:hypothetical protein